MSQYTYQKAVQAIQDPWPEDDVGKTIFIHQDNARTHVLPIDEAFLDDVAQIDLEIQLVQQPPNSPDMNVLDLSFFRSIQFLTDCRGPKTIRELIEGAGEEFYNYEVNKLSNHAWWRLRNLKEA